MPKLTRNDLWGLEHYAGVRNDFRAEVLAHKLARRIALGPHITLLFEDALTMKYQVQEMLRAERIFEPSEIQNELDTYNPLIPDGGNWKATMLIEYAEVEERRQMLGRLRGIEHQVWCEVDGAPRCIAIANEDMERSNDDKTAAVHFLRFELSADMRVQVRAGAGIRMGTSDGVLDYRCNLSAASCAALAADLRA